MGLIEDYKQIIQRIILLQREVPVLQKAMSQSKQSVADLENKIAALHLQAEQRVDTLMRQRLVELTNEEYDKLTHEQVTITNQISAYKQELNSKLLEVQSYTYQDKLSKAYALLNQVSDTLSCTTLPETLPNELVGVVESTLASSKTKYTQKTILKLISDVNLLYEGVSDGFSDSSKQNTIIDFLTLKSLTQTSWSNKSKLYAYMAYFLLLVVGCIVLPIIPITILSSSIAISFSRYSIENQKLLKFILPYSKLKDGYHYLQNMIDTKVEGFRKADENAVKEKYNSEISPLESRLEEIKYLVDTAEERVRSSISNSELKKSVQEQFTLKEKAFQDEIKNIELNAQFSGKELDHNLSELNSLKLKQQEMLPKIKDLYLNPKEPGTSPYLIKSFLISVDEEKGKLDEFNYGGQSTFIMYKGDSSDTNKSLITMMLMQFMANMSLANLEIHLTDVQSAGMSYAPFNVCIDIVSSSQNVKKLLTDMNTELINRRDTIAAVDEDIAAFNQHRMDTHGLTVPYILLILQDITTKEMLQEDFIQLVTTGPRVGIIPIVFVSHMYLNTASKVPPTDMPKLERFFSAFRYTNPEGVLVDNTFKYDGAKSSLSQDNRLIDVILSQLRKE